MAADDRRDLGKRTVEDYETTSSTVKTDFMRKWHHNRSGKPISLDEMMESEDGDIFDVADPAASLRTRSFPKCRLLLCRKYHHRERPGNIEFAYGGLHRTADRRQGWL